MWSQMCRAPDQHSLHNLSSVIVVASKKNLHEQSEVHRQNHFTIQAIKNLFLASCSKIGLLLTLVKKEDEVNSEMAYCHHRVIRLTVFIKFSTSDNAFRVL